jgi:hypothetical protein
MKAESLFKFKTEKNVLTYFEQPQQPEEKAESESEAEMEEDEEDEIPLDMEDIEAVSKRARQDEDLNTEHLQVIKHHIIFTHYGLKSFSLCLILVKTWDLGFTRVQHSLGRVQRSSEGTVKLICYLSALDCCEAGPG